MATVTLTVISPRNPLSQPVPGGVGYVGEVFEQARLQDGLTHAQLPDAWLAKSLRRLVYRYARRVRVRWVDPWSLIGLLFAVRYRVRTYPTVVIGNQFVYTGTDSAEFEALVIRQLETPAAAP